MRKAQKISDGNHVTFCAIFVSVIRQSLLGFPATQDKNIKTFLDPPAKFPFLHHPFKTSHDTSSATGTSPGSHGYADKTSVDLAN
jgi:hypothetical protein